MRYILTFVLLPFLTLVACGDDDDEVGGAAGDTCGVTLLSVEDDGDGDFRIRARNDNEVSGQVSFLVLYSEGDVQNEDQGIGLAADVDPGVTVDIVTIGGFNVESFDCARLRVNFIAPDGSIVCQNQPIGEDCYD